jgi:ADP-ribosylglycohydrolase
VSSSEAHPAPAPPAGAFQVELLGRKDFGPCECCGADSRTVWGFVSGRESASYFVHWTLGRVPEKGAHFDLVMGEWGEHTTDADRFAVSLAFRQTDMGPSFMVVDAGSRRIAASPLVARTMRRDEVIGTPLAKRVFDIVDAVWLSDPRIAELRGEVGADRYVGCLLGLALGDALGASFEGGPLERALWRFIGRTRAGEMRWTDDTQMSLDLADSLIARGYLDLDDLARRFARSYRWSRGYGPGTAKVLKRIARGADWRTASRSVHAGGSFGNGAAMRAPVIGLFHAHDETALVRAARDSASVTHAHPQAQEGAVLIASATAAALHVMDPIAILEAAEPHCGDAELARRLALVRIWLASSDPRNPRTVREQLGNGVAAVDSTVTALYAALRFLREPFESLHSFVIGCGGDVDTIGAMAGAVWGAANGATALPKERLQTLESRGRIRSVAESLFAVVSRRPRTDSAGNETPRNG